MAPQPAVMPELWNAEMSGGTGAGIGSGTESGESELDELGELGDNTVAVR